MLCYIRCLCFDLIVYVLSYLILKKFRIKNEKSTCWIIRYAYPQVNQIFPMWLQHFKPPRPLPTSFGTIGFKMCANRMGLKCDAAVILNSVESQWDWTIYSCIYGCWNFFIFSFDESPLNCVLSGFIWFQRTGPFLAILMASIFCFEKFPL